MVDERVLAEVAAAGGPAEVHDLLVRLTVAYDDAPAELLTEIAARLPANVAEGQLSPRQLVVMRLLKAGAVHAAWLVLQDNAVGVASSALKATTSSGARPRGWRLPLSTCIEPPHVFAWLPGFRDPRFDAPDDAFDITGLVTAVVRLDELWWDGPALVLSGAAYLRHLPAGRADQVEVVLRHSGGTERRVTAERGRRPDLVTAGVDSVNLRAWTGWCARVHPGQLGPSGLWKPSLRICAEGIEREARLAPRRGEAVPATTHQRLSGRRALTRFSDDRWLDLRLVAPAPLRLLHLVARSAFRR